MSKKRKNILARISDIVKYPDTPEEVRCQMEVFLERGINILLAEHPKWEFKEVVLVDLTAANTKTREITGEVNAIVRFTEKKHRKIHSIHAKEIITCLENPDEGTSRVDLDWLQEGFNEVANKIKCTACIDYFEEYDEELGTNAYVRAYVITN